MGAREAKVPTTISTGKGRGSKSRSKHESEPLSIEDDFIVLFMADHHIIPLAGGK